RSDRDWSSDVCSSDLISMGARMLFQIALEDLNAMILAADPCDTTAVACLGTHVEEILAAMRPTLPETEVLSLVLSILRSADSLEIGRAACRESGAAAW